MKWKKYAAILLLPLALAACSTNTKITSSWKGPNGYTAGKEDKILVLGMLPDKDRSMRENIEAELVKSLREQGYDAVSAYETFGPRSFKGQDEKKVMEELKDKNIQSIITIALLDKEKERKYTPGRVDYFPNIGYNPFWRRYVYYYDRVYNPGYYTNSTNYFVESNLYDVGSNRLVYSVQSKTLDPSSLQQMARNYSKAIVKDMEKNNILQKGIS
ncbi:MAG: hypothetical protein KF746_07700 [Chitinophagaceae bacterium]|nr:hypothetical protein [Chitinophagaceae bacterium]